ncbi:MAG: type VII secretion target [Candidatus Sericytochromatia bacterium]
MGPQTVRVDPAAVRAVAAAFDTSAGILDAHLPQLRFSGATAGRLYVTHGDALRSALDRLTDGLTAWSRASAEIGATLRVGVDRYQGSDDGAAAQFG